MTRFKLVELPYLRNGAAIYRLSEERVLKALACDYPDVTPSPVLVRMVHASGDPGIAPQYHSSPNAETIGAEALAAGGDILCDCEMVRSGIIGRRLPGDNAVVCTLNDAGVSGLASRLETTRSAAAVEFWHDRIEGSIVVIGNAPTALFFLLERLAEGWTKPALMIGMPVGFVGATEAKAKLAAQEVPFLTVHGTRGGSALAAAALNGLAGGLIDP